MMRRHRPWLLTCALGVAACAGSTDATTPTGSTELPTTTSTTALPNPSTTRPVDPVDVDPSTHTVSALRSADDFDQLSKAGIGDQSVLKFSITEFATDPEVEWLDSRFYTLHDEWYWFQLLNGLAVRGFDAEPLRSIDGRPDGFATVADAYEWAALNRDALPFDLRFTSLDRLYSPLFYDVALDSSSDRRIGAGSLIRTPDPADGADRWVIELEYGDEVSAAQVDTFFDVVGASLPTHIRERLEWVPRSRFQEVVAAEIEAAGGPNASRIVRYDELSKPGQVEVYSPAISAGRLLVVTEGGRWSLSDAGPNDIVAIDRAPDDLPQGNGLITGTPQTALAHVNILALNRGIPNAFRSGLADDPLIAQLGRVRAPVIVRTTTDGDLEIVPLTDAEYEGWLATQGRAPIGVAQVDTSTLPISESLESIAARATTTADLDELRLSIGGKATGFVELAAPGSTTMPPDAMAITIRPYVEHMAQFAATIDALLADSDLESARGRFLFLEGREDFDDRYTSRADAEFADEFTTTHRPGTPLGDALEAGGFVDHLRDSSIDPLTLQQINADLATNFATYAPEQGIRFRSSSTIEDIEGFNGAGLYDSNTGYLDPTVLPDDDDHKRTVERAILRTWSSYWGATAFEERQRENIDHRSGAMALLVHARFDDPLELSNGVATLTIAPNPDTAMRMLINVQAGDTSVTNADNEEGLLPEVIEVTVSVDGSDAVIRRLAASSIVAPDEVLDDEMVLDLFGQVDAVAASWLQRANAALLPQHRSTSLTLDIEFREMAAGWPAQRDGSVAPERMVVKQARTLDPGLRGVPAEILALPIPRDVLAAALSITEFSCSLDDEPIIGVHVFIDPFASIDFGNVDQPLERWAAGPDLDTLVDPTRSIDVAVSFDTAPCSTRELFVDPARHLLDLLASR